MIEDRAFRGGHYAAEIEAAVEKILARRDELKIIIVAGPGRSAAALASVASTASAGTSLPKRWRGWTLAMTARRASMLNPIEALRYE